jgi:hypothetical protein
MMAAIGLTPGGSAAQSQEKLVYAGESLGVLQSAVYTQHVTLADAGLTDEINERSLSALLILDGPMNQPVVFICPHRQTRLVSLELTGDDIDRLRRFAQDELFLALSRFPESGNRRAAIATIRQTVAGLPAERQATAQRFVGARAMELGLKGEEKKEFSGYIEHYQEFDNRKLEEKKVEDKRKSDKKKRQHK